MRSREECTRLSSVCSVGWNAAKNSPVFSLSLSLCLNKNRHQVVVVGGGGGGRSADRVSVGESAAGRKTKIDRKNRHDTPTGCTANSASANEHRPPPPTTTTTTMPTPTTPQKSVLTHTQQQSHADVPRKRYTVQPRRMPRMKSNGHYGPGEKERFPGGKRTERFASISPSIGP